MINLTVAKKLEQLHLLSDKKLQKLQTRYYYNIIKHSRYFDEQWYLEHNPDVKTAGADPVLHYLLYGWKEDRECTPVFDGNKYLRTHLDVYEQNINPLVHFELFGSKQPLPNPKAVLPNKICDYNDIASLKKLIDSHEIISFDVFDTLLYRPYILPTDLFEHLARIYQIADFKQIRISAEKKAREANKHKEDITLDDIYLQMPDELKFMQNNEIKLEEKVLQANPEMKKVFDYALQHRKKIIITSDMYLLPQTIKRLLNKNGYKNFTKLYVSSGVQKGKGKTLFEFILKDLNTDPQKILHIGDNINTDVKKPCSLGISAFHYHKIIDIFLGRNRKADIFWQNNKTFEASVLLMSLAVFNHQNREISYWQRFGYEYGGPVCYWYLNWIKNSLKTKRNNDFIFVARDGYTLEKIFNILCPNKNKTHYIYASRQLFINCNLDDAIADNRTMALLSAFKDKDEDINIAARIINNEDASREFVRNNYDKFYTLCEQQFAEYKKYIDAQKITGKNIVVIDTITGAGSSIKLLQKAFPEAKFSSFFWICLDSAKQYITPFNIKTFSPHPNHKHIATWDIIEYIMSAPEYPILRLENNQVVYKENISDDEEERIERYKIISDESIKFAKYIEKYFSGLLQTNEDLIVNWLNLIFDTNSQYDKKHLQAIRVCADSAHSIYRPIYSRWAVKTKQPSATEIDTNQLIKNSFDDLKLFINRIVEKKLSTMMMHQKTFPQFKNIHHGQDMVILASGPTLQYFEPFENCIYVGVNKSFSAQKHKLDYLFIQDFSGATSRYINNIKSLDCIKFYGLTCEDSFPERTIPEDVRLDAKAYPYRTDWEKIPNFQTEFAYDLSTQSLGCGGTVVFPALQFALWTHPKRIYLVGADTSCGGYFDNSGKNILFPNELIPLYRKFRDFAKQYYPNTEIISVNPVGLKGIFTDLYTEKYLQATGDKQAENF